MTRFLRQTLTVGTGLVVAMILAVACRPDRPMGSDDGLGGLGGTDGSGGSDSGDGGAASGGETSSGGADASGGQDAGSGGTADPGAPTVVAVQIGGETVGPDTLRGVRSDATIVIDFSEPMDKTSTQIAYHSLDEPIDSDNVAFSWNAASTRMTITPDESFVYDEVTDPDVDATAYTFTLSTTATSEGGVDLAAEYDASFSPLKRVTHFFPADDNSAYSAYVDGNPSPTLVQAGLSECHGLDMTDIGYAEGEYYAGGPGCETDLGLRYAIHSYDLTLVPDVFELESAEVLLTGTRQDNSYFSNWDGLTVPWISLQQLESDNLGVDTVNSTVGTELFTLESDETTALPAAPFMTGVIGTYEIQEQFNVAKLAGDEWLMFRAGFDGMACASGDPNQIVCTASSMTAVYLAE